MTRIASVTAHPVSVPLTQVLWTAHEELRASSVILVEVRTDDGLTGYGQIHGAPMKAICGWLGTFGEIIRGMDALAHVAVWERLFALTSPRPGGVAARDSLPPPLPRGERPQIMAAIGGIDFALWDIKGSTPACRSGDCSAVKTVRCLPTRPEVTISPALPTWCTRKSLLASSRRAFARSSSRRVRGRPPRRRSA